MKRFLVTLALLIIIISDAVAGCCRPQDYSFYVKVASGVSCSAPDHVCASYPPWNPALQGYDAPLGHAPIFSLNIGWEYLHVLDLEVNIANRSTFTYRKFQTPTAGGESYTREFDLNVTSIFFGAYLLGRGVPHVHKDIGCGTIYPMVGAGLGGSDLLITNYRTICLPPTGDSAPYASFSAENQYTLRRNFTYKVQIGVEYSHQDSWVVGTGYRWFDAGHFKGPRYQRVANGSAVDVACDTWKMRFRAHEWFIEFRFFV